MALSTLVISLLQLMSSQALLLPQQDNSIDQLPPVLHTIISSGARRPPSNGYNPRMEDIRRWDLPEQVQLHEGTGLGHSKSYDYAYLSYLAPLEEAGNDLTQDNSNNQYKNFLIPRTITNKIYLDVINSYRTKTTDSYENDKNEQYEAFRSRSDEYLKELLPDTLKVGFLPEDNEGYEEQTNDLSNFEMMSEMWNSHQHILQRLNNDWSRHISGEGGDVNSNSVSKILSAGDGEEIPEWKNKLLVSLGFQTAKTEEPLTRSQQEGKMVTPTPLQPSGPAEGRPEDADHTARDRPSVGPATEGGRGGRRRGRRSAADPSVHAEECHAVNLFACGQPVIKRLQMKDLDMKTRCRIREEFLNCMLERRHVPCAGVAHAGASSDPKLKQLRSRLKKSLATNCFIGYSTPTADATP